MQVAVTPTCRTVTNDISCTKAHGRIIQVIHGKPPLYRELNQFSHAEHIRIFSLSTRRVNQYHIIQLADTKDSRITSVMLLGVLLKAVHLEDATCDNVHHHFTRITTSLMLCSGLWSLCPVWVRRKALHSWETSTTLGCFHSFGFLPANDLTEITELWI